MNYLVMLFVTQSLFALEHGNDPALKKVTKTISLGQYVPHDLTQFHGVTMAQRIVPDLKKLLLAAQKDGLTLKVMSGYRSFAYQKNLFERYVGKELKKNPRLTRKQAEEKANTYSARPGHSEHQLGTVVDLLSSENNFQFSSDQSLRFVSWLEKNAPRWNFKISYTKESKEYIYEPWHIRWYPALS